MECVSSLNVFLLCVCSPRVFSSPITILVRALAKDTPTSFSMTTSHTGLDIKFRIYEEFGIPVEQQRIVFNEKEIQNSDTLIDFKDGSQVFLSLKLRGGGIGDRVVDTRAQLDQNLATRVIDSDAEKTLFVNGYMAKIEQLCTIVKELATIDAPQISLWNMESVPIEIGHTLTKLEQVNKHAAVVTAITLLQKDFITLYNRLTDGQYQTHMTRSMIALITYKEYSHKLRNVMAAKNILKENKNTLLHKKQQLILDEGSVAAKAKVMAAQNAHEDIGKLGTSHLTPMQFAAHAIAQQQQQQHAQHMQQQAQAFAHQQFAAAASSIPPPLPPLPPSHVSASAASSASASASAPAPAHIASSQDNYEMAEHMQQL
jgi:hypothetical protein